MAATAPAPEREGFLPIRTNAFDRGFISVVLLIFIHLLWMRFLEVYLPLWIATVICALLAFVIIRKG
jgi:predicted small integral membrane protein